jgi:hypothetical protein
MWSQKENIMWFVRIMPMQWLCLAVLGVLIVLLPRDVRSDVEASLLEVPPASEVLTMDLPRAFEGRHDLRIHLFRRNGVFHHGFAEVPDRDNFVHKVDPTPPRLPPLVVSDAGATGCFQVYAFDPAGNYASSGPHHLSGQDRILTVRCEGRRAVVNCEFWLPSSGVAPAPVETTLVIRPVRPWSPAGAGDSLPLDGAWPSVLGPTANASAPPGGPALVDALSEARLVWVSDDRIYAGRTTGLGYMKGRPLNFMPLDGTYATPVVGHGLVFHYDSEPVVTDDAPADTPADRAELEARGLDVRWWAKRRDHVVMAVDTATGRTVWRRRFIGKGGDVGGKGGGAGGCCLIGETLVCVGLNGFAAGFDARSGEVRWTTGVRLFNGSTAPMPIGGTVVCSQYYGGLVGLDPATGAVRWTATNASSGLTCALPWRDGVVERVISLGGGDAKSQSHVRLVCLDATSGALLWEHTAIGPNDVTMTISGDVLVTNGRDVPSTDTSKSATEGKPTATVAAYRLSATGAIRIWELPPEYRLNTYGYEQPCAGGGLVLPSVGHDTGLAVDLASGRIVARGLGVNNGVTKSGHAGGGVAAVLADGLAISSGFAVRDIARGQVLDIWRGPFAVGYLIPILTPVVDGRIFIRSHDSLLCYDLRRPAGQQRQTLSFDMPGGLFADPKPHSSHLRLRDGKLAGGLHHDDKVILAIETSRTRWDGGCLTGILGVDSGHHIEDVAVNATNVDGLVQGTLTVSVPAFAKPVTVAGAVHIRPRDPGWMPECTHVVRLENTTRNAAGQAKHLYLFLTVSDGRIAAVSALADHVTKAPVQLDAAELQIKDGRLNGRIGAVLRPDIWSAPQTEQGSRVAATWTIDADLAKGEGAGSQEGVWGIAWTRSLPLRGALRTGGASGR